MKFEVGDLVFIGWIPDHWHGFHTDPSDCGKQAEVIEYQGYQDFAHLGMSHKYTVRLFDGREVGAAEQILIKIPPEEAHGRKEEEKDKGRPETV